MTTVVATPAFGARRPRSLAACVGITVAGVGFNVLRMWLRLDHDPLWCSLVAFIGLGVATAAAARALNVPRRALGLTRPDLLPLAVGSMLVCTVTVTMAALTAPVTHVPSAVQLSGGVLLFAGCTGPAEELLFRGLLYGIVEADRGPVVATAVTAVSFAVVHVPAYGIGSIPVATAAGLLFGWLRWWCRSLLGPWLVHSVADLSLLWL
jgi:membrane protease YdiL (CAAX protease family)